MELDELELELIDGGADDLEIEEEYVNVTYAMEDFGNLNKKLESLKIEAESTELQRIPNTMVALSDEEFQDLMKLIDALEDDDDVQNVFSNANFGNI